MITQQGLQRLTCPPQGAAIDLARQAVSRDEVLAKLTSLLPCSGCDVGIVLVPGVVIVVVAMPDVDEHLVSRQTWLRDDGVTSGQSELKRIESFTSPPPRSGNPENARE